MAIETVRQLVTRLQEVEKELKASKEKLDALRSKHAKFWGQLKNECAQTSHNLTQEQIESYKREKTAHEDWYRRGRFQKYTTLQERWRSMPSMSVNYRRISNGYNCPYCRGHVGGAKPSWGIETWDGCARVSFNTWLNQDISNWPPEKKVLFERGKKEIEEYFAEAEPLEQSLEVLEKEKTEIWKQLEEIWSLCDNALGKWKERAKEEAEIERIIRKLNGTPSRDDVYYTD